MFGRNPRPNPSQSNPSGSYSRTPPGGPDSYGTRPSYGRSSSGAQRPLFDGTPSEKHEYARSQSDTSRLSGAASAGVGGHEWRLKPAKSPGERFIFGNMYV